MSNVRGLEDAPKHRAAVLFVIGAAATLVVVALIYSILLSAANSAKINERQQDAIVTIDKTDEILAEVRGCTTPGERCYERGLKQTAEAVGKVSEVIVLASACASGPTARDPLYIQTCVLDALKDKRKNP